MGHFQAIGDRFLQLRGGLSQKEFAKKLGISVRAYQYYEAGDRIPKGEELQRIAEACGISVDWLLTGGSSEAGVIKEAKVYYLDATTEKVMKLLEGLDKKGKEDVLKYIQEKEQAAAWRREKKQKEE